MRSQQKQPADGHRLQIRTKRSAGAGASDGVHSATSPDIVRMAESHAAYLAAHRHAMVAVAAYHRAERRGFAPGHELDDWLNAELEVEAAERQTLCPCDEATPAERASWATLKLPA
jgi:hypothetical protein